MTSLVHRLGLSSGLSWHDVYSLDDPSLLAFVPRPAHALLLVFPVTEAYEKIREREDGPLPEYSGSGPKEEVLWFKQTIGNACGLMGILHSVTNGMTRELIGMLSISFILPVLTGSALGPSTPLADLIIKATPMDPASRARLLETSPDLATAHAAAAAGGDTAPPSADEKVELHFVAFIKSPEGNLWELDGRRKGPLNRGKLPEHEDLLGEQALDLGPKKFLKDEKETSQTQDLRFSILALGPSFE